MGNNMTNSPNVNQWWHVVQFNHNNYYFVQIAIAFTSQTCEMYKRVAINHSWKSWLSFSPGTANTAQVLSGYTFSSANGSNLSGSMTNRGNLNWSSSNTTYSVPAGYYSGGTLDSRPSYNAGVSAADNRANSNSTNYKTGYNAGYAAASVSTSKVHAIEVTPGQSGQKNAGSWSYTCPSNGIILGTCTRGDPWLSVNGSAKYGTSVSGGYQYIISVSKGNVVTPANAYTRPNVWFIGS